MAIDGDGDCGHGAGIGCGDLDDHRRRWRGKGNRQVGIGLRAVNEERMGPRDEDEIVAWAGSVVIPKPPVVGVDPIDLLLHDAAFRDPVRAGRDEAAPGDDRSHSSE